jgi:hypothetical protein
MEFTAIFWAEVMVTVIIYQIFISETLKEVKCGTMETENLLETPNLPSFHDRARSGMELPVIS